MDRRRVSSLGVFLLMHHILGAFNNNEIPPVTLGVVGLQIAIFLRLIPLPWYSPVDVCISSSNVFRPGGWKKLIFGALEHGDDMHLYYNMVSLIIKGRTLERRFGSAKFAYLLCVFTFSTSATLVGLNMLASEFIDHSFSYQCAVGFSGVIFALKVLCTQYWPDTRSHYLMGVMFPIPASYVVWAELILIQLMVPNTSFMGHLAGILVGLAYVKGPLRFITDSVWNFGRNMIGYGRRRPPPPRPPSFYDNYVPHGMSEEEQYNEAIRASIYEQNQFNGSNQNHYNNNGAFYRNRNF